MATLKSFADLLREGIDEIQRKESMNEKKTRKEIYEELGTAISRQASTIDYYLRHNANVPRAINEVEILAREIFRRGGMDRKWLEQFLIKGDHPNPAPICDELLTFEVNQSSNHTDTLYKWLRLHHHVKRLSNRTLIANTQVELQVTSDSGLDSVRHRNIAEKPGELENLLLEFVPGKRDDQGRIDHRIGMHNPDLVLWYVLFDPPLRKGQIVSYSFTQTQEFFKYWTFEEYEQFFMLSANRRFASLRRTVIAPIDELKITIEFPPGYPITLPASGGFTVYRSAAEDYPEKTRLIAKNSFLANYDRASNQWVIQLGVDYAKLGLSYEIQWIPPRKDKISI